MDRRTMARTLVALDGFTAVTAMAGGVLLVTGREDDRFPAEALRRTPFSDYVLPGWMLGGVVGGSAGVAMLATLRDPRAGATASAVAGVVLVGCVAGGRLLLDLPQRTATDHVTDLVYLATGAGMTALGIALRNGT